MKKTCLAMVALAFAAGAQAQSPATVPELVQTQRNITLLKAQLEEAELKAKLAAAQAAASGRPAAAALPPPPPAAMAGFPNMPGMPGMQPQVPALPAGPQVIAIEGAPGKLQAVLRIDGAVVYANPGDRIAGGYLVKEITSNAAVLEKAGVISRIGFSADRPDAGASGRAPARGSF